MVTNIKIGPILQEKQLEGQKDLGCIDGSIDESQKDQKYLDWVSENMLSMNWILNLVEESIAVSFKYSITTKELWDSIMATYTQRRNIARILEWWVLSCSLTMDEKSYVSADKSGVAVLPLAIVSACSGWYILVAAATSRSGLNQWPAPPSPSSRLLDW